MNDRQSDLDTAVSSLIEAGMPRGELSTMLFGAGAKAAQPVVEKGLKKLAERTLECTILEATAGEVGEDGRRRLGWKIKIRNHTVVAYAVSAVELGVGSNAEISSTTGMGLSPQPDSLIERLIICPAEGSCEFWLRTDAGRGRRAIPVSIRLRALEGDRKHDLKMSLNRADDLGVRLIQKP